MRTDNIDLPFVDDEAVLGNWVYAGFVPTIASFEPGVPNQTEETWLTKMQFLPNGEMSISTGNGQLTPTSFKWTKGHLLNVADSTNSTYVIQAIDGADYLFFEWKSGDYIFRESDPYYYVFRREETTVNE
jgi:bla regulator protein BlaR1